MAVATSRHVRVCRSHEGRLLLMVWCPACDRQHPFWVQDPDASPSGDDRLWTWDGDMERPTFSPSLKVHPDQPVYPSRYVQDYRPQVLCHSYLEAGRWRYLDDCEHAMAGQTVDLPPLPDWLAEG